MVDDPKAEGERFFERWARRKAEASSPTTDDASPGATDLRSPPPGGAPLAPVDTPADSPDDGETAEVAEIDVASLPDVDSLNETSDFSVFMQNGVPEELQKRALQKLWRLDPSFNHIDGLLDYGEDYSGTGIAAEIVNTIYKVGKGMMTDEEEAAEIAAAGDGDSEPDEEAAHDAAPAPPAGTPIPPPDAIGDIPAGDDAPAERTADGTRKV